MTHRGGVVSVIFSRHARQQMQERGASEHEVAEAITHGERVPAKHGRVAYRRNFAYDRLWGGIFYRTKQVMPIVVHESNRHVVVTVYTFYF